MRKWDDDNRMKSYKTKILNAKSTMPTNQKKILKSNNVYLYHKKKLIEIQNLVAMHLIVLILQILKIVFSISTILNNIDNYQNIVYNNMQKIYCYKVMGMVYNNQLNKQQKLKMQFYRI